MHMEARTLCQPGAYLGLLVSGVVIDHQVEIKLGRNTGFRLHRKERNS